MLSSELEGRVGQSGFSAEQVAQDVLADARSVAQVGIRHLDDADSRPARMLISGLEEHSLVALSQAPRAAKPQNEGWILRTLGDEFRRFRTQLAELIDPMLAMKGPSKLTVEVRVCDEAYPLAHHLTNPAAKSDELADIEEFKAKPESERDDRIEELRKSRAWLRIREGF